MFSLELPPALLLLLIPAFLARRSRRQRRPALGIPDGAALAAAPRTLRTRLVGPVEALPLLALAFLALALAGPRYGQGEAVEEARGVDIVLAVDVSESMAGMDFPVNGKELSRLEAVKRVAGEFIASRKGDRVGLVAFGERADTLVPPTPDHAALLSALERLSIGASGKRTAIGDAVGVSVKRLRQARGQSRVVILFTDGRNNAGRLDPGRAARLAGRAGVKVHAVGVGGDAPAPFYMDHPALGRQVVYQAVEIDEKTLRELAGTTGGLYFRATDAAGLATIGRNIAAMDKTTVTVRHRAEYASLAGYFLVPALVLLALYALARTTWLAESP